MRFVICQDKQNYSIKIKQKLQLIQRETGNFLSTLCELKRFMNDLGANPEK